MSTLRVNTIQNSGGTGSPAINGLAAAWVNFNGTGTVAIRASNNVSSITDGGVGLYTINFITALTDANYSANVTTSSDGVSIVTAGINGTNSAMTTTNLNIVTWSTSAQVDRTVVNVTVFR